MLYREDFSQSESNKREYVDGLEALVQKLQAQASSARAEYAKDIMKDGERYRSDFRKMLGWPLTEERAKEPPLIKLERLTEEDGYTVFRAQVEILEGLWMTGLFFRLEGDGKHPLVLVQHGGLGTPEFIAGMYGDTANYNDMLQRVQKHRVHIFAPQVLVWHNETAGHQYGVKFDRVGLDARLKRVGSSITAVEVHGISRILDYFERQSYVSSFGMVGLSYGGFYTLFAAALDTRIQSAISCAFFNARDRRPWADWTWFESAWRFDDAEIACLVYPRRLCLQIANGDPLFDAEGGIDSFERVKALSAAVGLDWVELQVFAGTHEFSKDDAPIERMIRDLQEN